MAHKPDSELTPGQLERRQYHRAWRAVHKEHVAEYRHGKYLEQKDARSKYSEQYYQEHRQQYIERARDYRKKNAAVLRAYWRQRKTGCTQEQYDALYAAQDGKCALCGDSTPGRFVGNGKAQDFCADHDHETGRIRGLLCGNCNAGIGHLQDNSTLLRKAADYLDRFKT